MPKSLSLSFTVQVSPLDIGLLVTELQKTGRHKGLAHPVESFLDYCKTKCSVREYLSEVHGVDLGEGVGEPDEWEESQGADSQHRRDNGGW